MDIPLNEERVENSAQLLFNVLVVAAPLAINGLLTTAISGFSTLLVPRRLVLAGLEYTAAIKKIKKINFIVFFFIFYFILMTRPLYKFEKFIKRDLRGKL